MEEKLDPLSKIMLATQTINFMAVTVNDIMCGSTYSDAALGQSFAPVYKEQLESVVEQLKPIMESIGEFLNNHDAVCPIDVRITKAAFDILIGGKDSVNK